MRTLVALADHYEIPHGWLSDERQPEEVPISGFVGLLDPRPDQRKGSGHQRWYRQVTFGFAAWEFLRVFRVLSSYLEALPATPERPIIGAEEDEREQLKLLSTFLLQPLLAAEEAGEPDSIIVDIAHVPDKLATQEEHEQFQRKLRALGRMWEATIPGLLKAARAHAERS